MFVGIITWLVNITGIYLGIGFLFSLYFVLVGVNKIDPNAKEGSWGFRVLIFPGCVALWPVLFKKLLFGQTIPPMEKNAHRNKAAM